LKLSPLTQRLSTLGALIFQGHAPANIAGAEVVVTSTAISADNPEVAEAHRLHVPVIRRAEMLAELMRLKYGIAVAGMHGKTTTTSMIAAVLAAGGLDPTVVVGGRVDAMGSNARLGNSQYLVAEADESDRSFLMLSPIIAVVTNIDREHMDCYRSLKDIKRTFLDFMERVPFYGTVVLCNDDRMLRSIFPELKRRMATYGLRKDSDFRIFPAGGASSAQPCGPGSRFRVRYHGQDLGEFRLRVPGAHNVLNATAAVAVGVGLDIAVPHIQEALEAFRGVDRRFQLKGTVNQISVVDDYGHHPTEIRATLAAARACGYQRVHVVFQPHRYTRTHHLMDGFATCFQEADSVLILDVYPASEQPIPGVTGEALARRIAEIGRQQARYAASFAEAAQTAAALAEPGDVILTLGAGSISQLGLQILRVLDERTRSSAVAP
jgi:UDP-N-acetylmuramate--alanine ligase